MQYLLFSAWFVLFSTMNVLHFRYQLIHWEAGRFYFLTIVNYAPVSIWMQMSLQHPDFYNFCITISILAHLIASLIFFNQQYSFSWWPYDGMQEFYFLHILTNCYLIVDILICLRWHLSVLIIWMFLGIIVILSIFLAIF